MSSSLAYTFASASCWSSEAHFFYSRPWADSARIARIEAGAVRAVGAGAHAPSRSTRPRTTGSSPHLFLIAARSGGVYLYRDQECLQAHSHGPSRARRQSKPGEPLPYDVRHSEHGHHVALPLNDQPKRPHWARTVTNPLPIGSINMRHATCQGQLVPTRRLRPGHAGACHAIHPHGGAR